ncbi:MAG: thioredoxin [Gammaproteobacteria bacterium]|nr:thioredoxin [Gammaproteobacteria bacterium]MDH5800127.1 thioredoxin [Gammaproteobacteria bacterium]
MVTAVTKDNFTDIINNNDMVIVDFWAPWCGPCKSFAPVFEAVAEANPDVTFAKVNTEEQQELAAHFQIRSIPTLMVFREQIIIFSNAGALPQSAMEELITQVKTIDMDQVREEIAQSEAVAATAKSE